MNELNYATLPACQRLKDAGIVLETEAAWYFMDKETWVLIRVRIILCGLIPAPTLAEVWRELPDGVIMSKVEETMLTFNGYVVDSVQYNTNSTDAAIDLLIWLKEKGLYK